jgi:hypothetical protein
MIKMTHMINLTLVIKVVVLDTSHIFNCNLMVGLHKKNSSECSQHLVSGFYLTIPLWVISNGIDMFLVKTDL